MTVRTRTHDMEDGVVQASRLPSTHVSCGVVLDSSGPTVHSGCTSFTSVGLLSHLSLVLLQDHRGGKPKICVPDEDRGDEMTSRKRAWR